MTPVWCWPRRLAAVVLAAVLSAACLPHPQLGRAALPGVRVALDAAVGADLAALLLAATAQVLGGAGLAWSGPDAVLRPWAGGLDLRWQALAPACWRGWALAPLHGFAHLAVLALWLGLALPFAGARRLRRLQPRPVLPGLAVPDLGGGPWWRPLLPVLPLATLLWSVQPGGYALAPALALLWLTAAGARWFSGAGEA